MVSRIVLGLRGSSHGIFVSRAGTDALLGADEDLLLDTDKRTALLIVNGDIVVPHGATVTINHGLGYIPMLTYHIIVPAASSGNGIRFAVRPFLTSNFTHMVTAQVTSTELKLTSVSTVTDFSVGYQLYNKPLT